MSSINIFTIYFILLTRCIVNCKNIEFNKPIFRYKKLFHVANETYTENTLLYLMQDLNCTTIVFTDVVRKPGCLPIYVKNKLCAGLCASGDYPRFRIHFDKADKHKSCSSCSPSYKVAKKYKTMCRKSKDSKSSLFSTSVNVLVSKECSCHYLQCKSFSQNQWVQQLIQTNRFV